eukprot:1378529-Rhodomonas_salina.1
MHYGIEAEAARHNGLGLFCPSHFCPPSCNLSDKCCGDAVVYRSDAGVDGGETSSVAMTILALMTLACITGGDTLAMSILALMMLALLVAMRWQCRCLH